MLNALELIERVNERIHDRGNSVFEEDEKLRVADDAIRSIFGTLRQHGEAEQLDSADFLTASGLTQLERGVNQFTVPEYMADVQLIEVLNAAGGLPYQIPKVGLEWKDISRGMVSGCGMVWHFGARGTLHVRGELGGWPTLRIWYVRRIPPMFYGVGGVGSTTTILIPSATVGGWKQRSDMYVGTLIETTQTSNEIKKVTAHVTTTLTTEPFLGAMAGVTFATVSPLKDEYNEYFVELCSRSLLRRQGSAKEQALASAQLAELQQDFVAGVSRRSTGEPPRLFSSRNFR